MSAAAGPHGGVRTGAAGAARSGDEDRETFTREQLAAAGEVDVEEVRALEQFGLLRAVTVGGNAAFDRDALAVVRAAAGLAKFGVEPRHLRAWRNAADREADLFEQVVMPMVRQRNPEGRRQATAALDDLTRFGRELHSALLRLALRDLR